MVPGGVERGDRPETGQSISISWRLQIDNFNSSMRITVKRSHSVNRYIRLRCIQ